MTNDIENRLFANLQKVKQYPADLRDELPDAEADETARPKKMHGKKGTLKDGE